MSDEISSDPVEELFAQALEAKLLLIGRDALSRSKSHLHFV